MANQGLAVLEDALRAHRLDRTLTTALPPLDRTDTAALAATDVAALDARLRGGLPRGQLSEIVGPRSSGRTSLLLQMLAAATRRGEIAALVDTLDGFDVASAVAARVDLERLLWIRGDASSQGCGFRLQPEGLDRAVNRGLKALNLVLQAGGFGLVALDLADVPASELARIPFTTWLRVQRTIEGSDTVCVLLAPQPIARSAGGVMLSLSGRSIWTGSGPQASGPGPCFLSGLDISVRVVSPRRRLDGDAHVRCAVRG